MDKTQIFIVDDHQIYCSNTDKKSLNEAIEAGGLGYLSKDVTEEEFLLALKRINKGENYYSSGITLALS